MAESVGRSFITSAISAEKPRASKRDGKASKTSSGRTSSGRNSSLFAELARLAEMSAIERRLRDFGFRAIAGTDEVGRGALAGPVVAACVILDAEPPFGVNDSKLLTAVERQALCRLILARARSVAIAATEPGVIDRINILQASKLAMQCATENLDVRPDVLLLDAVFLETLEIPQVPLIEGDRRSVSIAAASVVAKVYRDSLMESYHALYPQYDFRNNRGYGTEVHLHALAEHGPSPIHRRSFDGVVCEPAMLFDS